MSQSRLPLILLALVVVAGLGGGAWFLLGDEDGGGTRSTVVAGPGEEAAVEPDEEAATQLADAPRAGSTLTGGSAREGGRTSFTDEPDPDDARYVVGRVLTPPGMPADDTLAIVALACEPDTGWDERPDSAWGALDRKLPDGVRRTHRTLEADGSFRVPVDSRATRAFLYVDGRYAFLAEPVEVELPAGGSDDVPAPRLEPALGAWLTGRVTIPLAPEELRALDDAEVGLGITRSDDADSGFGFRFGGRADRTSALDAEGRFSFRGLDPEAIYDVAFRHEDYLPKVKSKIDVTPGAHEVADLEVDVGGRVAGRVVDESGQGVADATVRQEREGFRDFLGGGGRASTEADGSFVVKGLRPGEVSLRASADGFVASEPQKVRVGDAETLEGVVLTLPSGRSIAGRVIYPDGAPAVRARVYCEPAGSGEGGFNWTRAMVSEDTNEDGRFVVTGLDADAYHLRASVVREPARGDDAAAKLAEIEAQLQEAGPFAEALRERLLERAELSSGPRWTARVEDVAAGTTELLMTLEAPIAIEGVVRDETGAPVTSFSISARPDRDGFQFLPGSNEVESDFEDPAGAFRLEGLQPGRWTISAEAEGYAATGEDLHVKVPEEASGLELVLSRACRVTGLVLDPTGRPVEDADVRTGSRGGFRGAGRVERSKRRSAKTDEEGRFELEDVPAENTVISATAEGWAASDTLPIEPLPGGELVELVLRLKLGGTLTGEVQSAQGPVARARVRYNSMSSMTNGAVTAEADGTFRVERLTPGLYQVMVEPDPEAFMDLVDEGGEQPDMSAVFEQLKMASVEIVEGETAHVVLGEAPKNPVRVFGRLTEGGEPVSGRMVIAMAEGEQLMSSLRMDQTDEDGRFELKLKAPGPAVFSVQLDGGSNPQFFEDVPEVETWEVELELPTSAISGTVFDPDGDPVPNVSVRISAENGAAATVIDLSNRAATDAGGGFSFKNLQPGTYTVRAGGSAPFGGGDGAFGTQLVSGIEVGAGEHRRDVDVRLVRSGRVEGVVLTAAGAPADGAAVYVRDANGRLLSPFSGCVTNASGRFTYEGVAPGAVTVSARLGSEATSESGGVVVREGEAAEVELQLESGTMLIVTLEAEDGVAQRAQVRVFDEDGREHSGMAGQAQLEEALSRGFSTREHRIGPLPAGRFVVVATTADGEEHKKPVSLRGQDERRLRIRVD